MRTDTPQDATTLDTSCDSEADELSTPVSASRKRSAHGLELLSNGAVSMRALELTKSVPTKTRDEDAPTLHQAKLSVSKEYTLFSLVIFGKDAKTEKIRDERARWSIFHSAAPYCLLELSKKVIVDADKEESSAYVVGLAKIAQQTLSYSLPGTVINHMCEKVLTIRDVHPSDDVKVHLGLTGDNAGKTFMHL